MTQFVGLNGEIIVADNQEMLRKALKLPGHHEIVLEEGDDRDDIPTILRYVVKIGWGVKVHAFLFCFAPGILDRYFIPNGWNDSNDKIKIVEHPYRDHRRRISSHKLNTFLTKKKGLQPVENIEEMANRYGWNILTTCITDDQLPLCVLKQLIYFVLEPDMDVEQLLIDFLDYHFVWFMEYALSQTSSIQQQMNLFHRCMEVQPSHLIILRCLIEVVCEMYFPDSPDEPRFLKLAAFIDKEFQSSTSSTSSNENLHYHEKLRKKRTESIRKPFEKLKLI